MNGHAKNQENTKHTQAADGAVVRSPGQVSSGDRLRIRLADGDVPATAD